MTDATRTILRAALAADPTIPAEEREGWERALRDGLGAEREAARSEPPRLYSAQELAAALGVSQDYVRHMAKRGSIVRVKCPGMRPRYAYPEFRPTPPKRPCDAVAG
jgi:hypothetical protein